MYHSFDVDIASEYGILEAVILNFFAHAVESNEANGRNYHDGHYWTYNSIKAFQKIFPYATDKKIRNTLKHLEDEELVIVGNYNNISYDRTKWYALTDKGKSILPKSKIHFTERANGNSQKGKPIPFNNTLNKTLDIYSAEVTNMPEGHGTSPLGEMSVANAESVADLQDLERASKVIVSYSEETSKILDYLNKKLNKSRGYGKSKANVSKIHARLKEGFTVDDFITVIDYKYEQWNNDLKMQEFLRPETLFGTKFEGYLNSAPDAYHASSTEETSEDGMWIDGVFYERVKSHGI